jgi:hypothetical protein
MSNDVSVISFSNPSFIKHRLLKLTAQHNKSMDAQARTATLLSRCLVSFNLLGGFAPRYLKR